MFCGLLQRFFPEPVQEISCQSNHKNCNYKGTNKERAEVPNAAAWVQNPESATCTQSKSYGNGNNDFLIHCSMAFSKDGSV